MTKSQHFFFCGIGGSGMLPLAMILNAQGHTVTGSDRALDQDRTPEKFAFLRGSGIALFPQDGSGISSPDQTLVASAAVEDTVPDVAAALRVGAPRVTRATLLASLFNGAAERIAIGGTSGKSTTTGMTGWILDQAGKTPTIVNGAVMPNFTAADNPFASAVSGSSDLFVCEVDESDGSIAQFTPTIAVLNNITLDHKSMEELRALFTDFVAKARTAVLNLDDPETATIAQMLPQEQSLSYGIMNDAALLSAHDLMPSQDGTDFQVTDRRDGRRIAASLPMPGTHNVSNALAALAASAAAGVPLDQAVAALSGFKGIRRRLERVGTANTVTVYDDFGHNPDKIAATLKTLHQFPGRLLVMFQPHGFGPLKHMKAELIACFTDYLSTDDLLVMPEPVYYGGTTDRSISSGAIIDGVQAAGRHAHAFPDRAACGAFLLDAARAGDRIIVMGARDDTLSDFAAGLLSDLDRPAHAGLSR